MNFHFENNKLNEFFSSLYTSLQNEDGKSLKIQKELDLYIKFLCDNPNTKPSQSEILNLKENINKLSAIAEQKRNYSENKVLKQKRNSKAIAKYRSV
ncbi:hypothetical protein CJF42_22555 [Pseudoalteromonas sp. NBT06-2]|uniref:hypothetical protein n=1 Tax=Pseudoalteromonas sp. NBT06-2 TaxID=2025950 RepID=UPI000BA6B7DE|nr:hypothetical protein [Pseudoalteromonas sp. NBT06-2]PAJ72205.1 hypothetical protein CJF42_22555 [Pseudoalteromonas sp. NBT06-2]